MFTMEARGAEFTARRAVPCETISLARLALSCAGGLDSVEVAGNSIWVAGSGTVP